MTDNYYTDYSAISSSMMRLAEDRGLPVYRDMFVTKTIQPEEPTDAMKFGTLVHAMVLEPDTVDARFMAVPKLDMRKKADKELAAELAERATAEGKMCVCDEDFGRADVVRAAVMRHKEAACLIGLKGEVEEPAYWHDTVTGMLLKRKVDKIADGVCIVDLKTTKDLPTFDNVVRAIRLRRYDAAAAHYLSPEPRGVGFAWIFAQTDYPYAVAVYWASNRVIEDGAKINRRTLNAIHEATTNGDWSIQESRNHENIIESVRY